MEFKTIYPIVILIALLHSSASAMSLMFTQRELSLLMTTTYESKITKDLFWHQKLPTVGLRQNKNISNTTFIPHCFTLWQLAPKKGKGVKVAVIDTGIALRKNNNKWYEVHPQLNHHSFCMPYFLNIRDHDADSNVNHLITFLHQHTQLPFSACEKAIMRVLQEYCEKKTLNTLKLLVKDHALEIIKTLIEEYDKKKFFTPITLTSRNTFFELLPCTKNRSGIANHGTVLCGIIGAREHEQFGPIGIAPHAELIMIRAFDDYGYSNKGIVLHALEKAHALEIPLINISLKIADSWSDDAVCHKIETIIRKIPYVVAASGNCGDAHAVRHEAYPARLPSVAFDVGAFAVDNTIAPFSQYEHTIGPKFVAPGFNIVSTTFDNDPTIEYGLFHGTSVAAALVTGFFALVLSEFGDSFTRDQLLKVCYKATVRLQDTQEWKTKTLLGTIDMRLALCMLHALYRFRELLAIKSGMSCDFQRDFDRLLLIVHAVFYDSVVSPYFLDVSQAIDYVVNKMVEQVHSDVWYSSDNLNNSTVFSSLPFLIQQRIQLAYKI